MPALDEILTQKISKLQENSRFREPVPTWRKGGVEIERNGKTYLSFSCNDYLGLSNHPEVKDAAKEAIALYGAGAGASRLVTGEHPLYGKLEKALAQYKDTEAACLFGSGYLANVGVIPALVGKGDVVIADKLVHACILDGIAISGAKLLRFKHNDIDDCKRLLQQRGDYRNCLVITETIFSMDGDCAPMAHLRSLCDEYDAWLMSDDAHGLYGKNDPVIEDVRIGTLSKVLGSMGGYVTGSAALIAYLKSAARPAIFATALPPASVAAALKALEIVQREPERAGLVLARAKQFTAILGLAEAQSTIVPLIIGEEGAALAMSKKLEQKGFLVTAIRPPTVPEGTSRLRFAFSCVHTEEMVRQLGDIIKHEISLP